MTVHISVLGRFRVVRDGVEVPVPAFGGSLTRRLVRVLVAARGAMVRRDALVEALWSLALPHDPAANLKVLVSRARGAVGGDGIVTVPGGYALAPAPLVEVDAELFLRLTAQGRRAASDRGVADAFEIVRRALPLWGEPLPEDLDEPWASAYRVRLQHAHEEALEMAASAALAAGDTVAAQEHADALLEASPLRENAHRLRIRAAAAAGDNATALAAYANMQSLLSRELGADPSPETQQLHLQLLRGERVDGKPGRPAGAGPPLLRFVGRAAQLEDVLGAVRARAQRPVFVAGAAGYGKSRLLTEVSTRAALPVVSVGARLPERGEDWSLARSLVRQLLQLDPTALAAVPHRAAVALADIVPEAAELRDLPALPLSTRTRRALVVHAVACLISQCRPSRVLLLVDDLQWADPTSTALLAQLIGRFDKLRAVLAYRPEDLGSDEPVARLLHELSVTGAQVLRLPELGDGDLLDLVPDGSLRRVLAGRTDRSPFAVADVLGALAERHLASPDTEGRWTSSSPAAGTVAGALAEAGHRRVVTARLHGQPPRRRELVGLLALLGRPVPGSLVATALDASPRVLRDDLQALTDAGLLQPTARGWQVSHDLIGGTVTHLLRDAQRIRLHARLAGVLTDPAEVAVHLAGAGDARAADMYATAAADRLTRYAAAEALDLADAGLVLQPAPGTRRRLLGIRAEGRAHTGDLAGARDDLRAALLDEPRGAGRAQLLGRLAMLTFGADDPCRAAGLADLALVEAGTEARSRADALAVAAVVDMNVGEHARSRRRSGESLRLLRQLGDSRRFAEVDDDRAMNTFLSGNIREGVQAFRRTARLLLDCGDLVRAVTPCSTGGHGLVFQDEPVEALAETTAAVELARSLGHPEAEAYALWHHSEALAANDRLIEALDAADDSLGIARRIDHRGRTSTAHRALGIAHELAGDLDAAEAAFALSLDAATGLRLFSSWAAARLAMLHLARHDIDRAEPLVRRALAEAPPLARYEARVARCRLAVLRAEPSATSVVDEAIQAAEAGGHEASVPILRRMLETAGNG